MTAHPNSDLEAMQREDESWRTRSRLKSLAREDRSKQRKEVLAQARREHAELLDKPLIASDLLSSTERDAIRASVVMVQRWKQQY